MDPPFGDYRQEAVRGYALGYKISQSQQHVSLLDTVLGVGHRVQFSQQSTYGLSLPLCR